MHSVFENTLRALAPIPNDQMDRLLGIATPKHVGKGEHFLRAGDIPGQFGFNVSGLFRYYYIDRKGNDYTKDFVPERRLVISYSAMIQNRESHFSIEALEDSELLVMDYAEWQQIFDEHICWTVLVKVLVENAFMFKEKREKEFLLDDAETRYRVFLDEFPDLEGRVKQYQVASYLGITPVALSRIRKKMSVLT